MRCLSVAPSECHDDKRFVVLLIDIVDCVSSHVFRKEFQGQVAMQARVFRLKQNTTPIPPALAFRPKVPFVPQRSSRATSDERIGIMIDLEFASQLPLLHGVHTQGESSSRKP